MIKRVKGGYQALSRQGQESGRSVQDSRFGEETLAPSGVLQAPDAITQDRVIAKAKKGARITGKSDVRPSEPDRAATNFIMQGVGLMVIEPRDRLEVMKAELEFLLKGGYHGSARAPWRPQLMFQDSPTCLNFGTQERKPCNECVLMQFVPEDFQAEKIPCRHIHLNEQKETVDFFYKYGTREELETAVAQWLKTTIAGLERDQAERLRDPEHPKVHVRARFVSGR